MATNKQTNWDTLQQGFLAYRQGDAGRAREVFEALVPLLTAYFRARTGVTQDSEDLAQACLLKLHFARSRYDSARPFKTWVYTVASRCLIDHWRGEPRRRGAQGSDGDEALAAVADTALPHDLKYEFNDSLVAALETLKPLDRSIVYLYGVEGLSMAEVAEAVDLTEAAVKVRAHRSYVKLRALLKGTGALIGALLIRRWLWP